MARTGLDREDEIGRATIQALAINDPSFRAVRVALRHEGILDRD
jgi:hypothetical protein